MDDSSLFAGLFIFMGMLAHAWITVSKMPSRPDAKELLKVYAADGAAADPAPPPPAALSEDPASAPQAVSGDMVAKIAALEEQVKRLIAREGRDQGLLGAQGGRRAAAKGSLKARTLTKASNLFRSNKDVGASAPGVSV